MNQKTLKYIIGNYKITNVVKDTDGDKVVDILDCEPNNPNKQGWIHDKIKNWNKERGESKVQESEFKRQAQEAGEQKYAEERVKYLKEKSTKAAVARARAPSFGESVGSAVRGFVAQRPVAKRLGTRSDRNRDGSIDVLGLNRKKGKSKQPGIFNMKFY